MSHLIYSDFEFISEPTMKNQVTKMCCNICSVAKAYYWITDRVSQRNANIEGSGFPFHRPITVTPSLCREQAFQIFLMGINFAEIRFDAPYCTSCSCRPKAAHNVYKLHFKFTKAFLNTCTFIDGFNVNDKTFKQELL